MVYQLGYSLPGDQFQPELKQGIGGFLITEEEAKNWSKSKGGNASYRPLQGMSLHKALPLLWRLGETAALPETAQEIAVAKTKYDEKKLAGHDQKSLCEKFLGVKIFAA